MNLKKNYIDGIWCEASDCNSREITNPATGETIAYTAESTLDDVAMAISAAKKAFYEERTWRDMDSQSRADILLKVADLMEQRKNEIATTDTMDGGKPLREAEGDVEDAIHCFRYYAGLISAPHGQVYDVPDGFGKMHCYCIHEPIGVCGQITPWNYPVLMATWKLAPALAAGNTIVFKPSTNTPLSAVILFEIFEKAGIPKGTVNLVMGSGSKVGHAIAASNDVDMVTFTGSTATGQDIATAAVSNLKKVGLELGGKSPNIIFEDCDLEGAVEWAMVGTFFNQGEVCSACARIYVQRSIKDLFVQRLVEKASAMTIGNGLDNPDLGAMVSLSHMEKVLGYIDIGIKEGAKLMYGGKRYIEGACANGAFLMPTIFDDCTQDMTIVKEEIFGPVACIIPFDTEEEVIRMANDTEYGLAGSVCTKDIDKALRVMKEIRAGIIWINCNQPTFSQAPWGGYKMSGLGRELGVYGLEEYQEVKQVNIALNAGPIGWYTHG